MHSPLLRPKKPNQAMQLTASKPAIDASRAAVEAVCCDSCTEGSRQLILCLVRCSAFHAVIAAASMQRGVATVHD